MSIDISQFRQVFFEESYENLELMENGLLDLQEGDADPDTINVIFRGAHSIKGGSGTFGFTVISEFTHILETLLDEMREGKREVTQESVDLFLQSVDCMRELLQNAEADQLEETEVSKELTKAFKAILDGGAGNDSVEQTAVAVEEEAVETEAKWNISFAPAADVLCTGNEPLRMFRALSEYGDFKVNADCSDVPNVLDLNPEDCYLRWDMELQGILTQEDIEEVFEWVIDEAKIDIRKTELASAEKKETPILKEPESNKAEETPEPPKAESPAAKPQTAAKKSAPASREASSIRVDTSKVDGLINLVGELVIIQSMLGELGENFELNRLAKLQNGLAQLEHNTRELQESVMRIRMLPISFCFNRFPRLVRDLARQLDKKVELVITGEQTELDKTVMEKIGDPLVHLVRNAVDHGIEAPDVRVDANKPETGRVELNAYHQGGNIVIEIKEDGAGLKRERIVNKAIEKGIISAHDQLTDDQVNMLIFEAGFSTAAEVSDVSGRGVGMDVVRSNIQSLGGRIEIESKEGYGTTFRIRLPLTLAILDGQLVKIKDHIFIIPLVSIIESLQVKSENINVLADGTELMRLREDYVPILRLYKLFNIGAQFENLTEGLVVVVENDKQKVGLFVDELLGQQQVVIKSLEANYQRVEGVSGATILGDGTVALILDCAGLITLAQQVGQDNTIITDDSTATA